MKDSHETLGLLYDLSRAVDRLEKRARALGQPPRTPRTPRTPKRNRSMILSSPLTRVSATPTSTLKRHRSRALSSPTAPATPTTAPPLRTPYTPQLSATRNQQPTRPAKRQRTHDSDNVGPVPSSSVTPKQRRVDLGFIDLSNSDDETAFKSPAPKKTSESAFQPKVIFDLTWDSD